MWDTHCQTVVVDDCSTTGWWPLGLHILASQECDFSTKDILLVISMDCGYGSVFLQSCFPGRDCNQELIIMGLCWIFIKICVL